MAIMTKPNAEIMAQLIALLMAIGPASALPQERSSHEGGFFEYIPTASGIVIAAPHGHSDVHTDVIAVKLAQALNSGYLVARGFLVDKTRINVNRPTEGISKSCSGERQTRRAHGVYAAYRQHLYQATGRQRFPLRLYVEIHGNSNPRMANVVEAATLGISEESARRIKQRFPSRLAAVSRRDASYPELSFRMEPADRIHYTAACAKRLGVFSLPVIATAIHIELPLSARKGKALESTVVLLADLIKDTLELQHPQR